MSNKLTSGGQVTIPKHIRNALNLSPGCAVNAGGQVVMHPATARIRKKAVDRFEAVRGKATIK